MTKLAYEFDAVLEAFGKPVLISGARLRLTHTISVGRTAEWGIRPNLGLRLTEPVTVPFFVSQEEVLSHRRFSFPLLWCG
jgi:hypothetical protein